MGKEWLHWVGVGGGGGGRSSGRRGRSSKEAAATSAGCMCAVFQIFDNFHHFHFPSNQQNSSDFNQEEPTTIPNGAEAPRNSLELDDEKAAAMDAAAPRSIAMKGEENLNLPVSINRIKTKHISSSSSSSSPRVSTTKSRTIIDDFSSECSSSNLNSPGLSKTPNLVARLMGLDLLPESTSPSISRTRLKSHLHQQKYTNFFEDDIRIGSRSLPETPRISSSARRSDVEYHTHRLSLQINKENIIINDEKCLSRRGRFRQLDSQNITSPGQYAKEIVKQVKESVSRRAGLTDITNTCNRNREIRRDENLILNNHSNYKKNEITKSPRVDSVSSDNPLQQNKDSKKDHEIITGKCSTSSSSDYIISKNKIEEAFVRLTGKKSKKSSEILNISGPTLLQVKKDPSPPPTKLPQKQSQVSDALSSKRSTQLSSRPNHSYKQLQLHPHKIFTVQQNDGCATATRSGAALEYGIYIQSILKRAGIINKPPNLLNPHSHPLDPLIFHYLELHPPSAAAYGGGESSTILRHRCNRKLIFQLVDEILAEIVKPHFNFKTPNRSEDDHFPLADELCMKIDSFPAANCQDLEDIDSLIDKDLSKSSQLNGFFEEDGESIVCEIEGDIMEWLVRETVALICGPYGGGTDKD